ncbi:MAG TPA: YicC/YloC family endoribonuclease [Vicinamibacterales bacterium]|nr:YicC/YloC family endoribonuclease [Vicinamibacterales bacterium]
MIKSMTGFASLTRDDEHGAIGVTIRSVNHRFLDLQLRLPPAVADVEPRLRAIVQKHLARGRVEVSVSLQLRQVQAPQIELNEGFMQALAAAVEQARTRGLVAGHLTPGDLLRLPQAVTIREKLPEAGGVSALLGTAIDAAVESAIVELEAMRVREGQHLRTDLDTRKSLLAGLIARIVTAANTGRADLETRLLERARELAAALPIDQSVLSQEVVRVAQRSDITEEVTRFYGHLAHWDALSDSPEPCGRKLDFLLQEMNREVNTIGSKADGLQISEVVIEAKAELERMREQVQNVE